MNAEAHRAFVLAGPTASGKTAVAQHLAELAGSEILSADSMLLYRGMDVGTAKPGADLRSRVRYHGIDLVPPSEPASVALWLASACRAFEQLAPDRPMIVVGGTGLYLKALIEGLAELPPPDPSRRAAWEALLAREGVGALQAALRERAPALCDALADACNPRRLIRALELADAGVRVPPTHWRAPGGGAGARIVGLRLPPADLKRRIVQRVDDMYRGGLLEETRRLWTASGGLSATARQAIGYAEAAACLEGRLSEDAARAETVRRTWALARRQMTWFRHQAQMIWIDILAGEGVAETAARVRKVWEETGPVEVACGATERK